MLLSRRIALGGEQLDEIDPWIAIRRIEDTSPQESIAVVDMLGGAGQRITGSHFGLMEVTVTWALDIHAKEALERRAVYERVMRWANRKGWLTVNDKENRRMYVDKVIFPDQGDIREWTKEYEIIFRAYNVPFWQQETPESASAGPGASVTVSLQNPGTTESVLDIRFRNASGMEISTVDISATGGSNIKLRNLGLQAGETLLINHGTDGILHITAGGRSALAKVQPGSSDDLVVAPGGVNVTLQAQRAGELTASCYGRYI